MKGVLGAFGAVGCVVIVVLLGVALTFGGIWLNGQFQRAQNNANTQANTTSQQYVQAEQQLMAGLAQDWYREGCDRTPTVGVCVSIINRLRVEVPKIDAQYVPADVNTILTQWSYVR